MIKTPEQYWARQRSIERNSSSSKKAKARHQKYMLRYRIDHERLRALLKHIKQDTWKKVWADLVERGCVYNRGPDKQRVRRNERAWRRSMRPKNAQERQEWQLRHDMHMQYTRAVWNDLEARGCVGPGKPIVYENGTPRTFQDKDRDTNEVQ